MDFETTKIFIFISFPAVKIGNVRNINFFETFVLASKSFNIWRRDGIPNCFVVILFVFYFISIHLHFEAYINLFSFCVVR